MTDAEFLRFVAATLDDLDMYPDKTERLRKIADTLGQLESPTGKLAFCDRCVSWRDSDPKHSGFPAAHYCDTMD